MGNCCLYCLQKCKLAKPEPRHPEPTQPELEHHEPIQPFPALTYFTEYF